MICRRCGKPVDAIEYREKGRRDFTLTLDGDGELEADGGGALLVDDFAYEHECGQKLRCMNDKEAIVILKEDSDEQSKEGIPALNA
ncbi:MAG: hypothetical protein Q8P12_04345 [bacterium]|nr:hypothetical protein [bacterium]